MQPGTDASHLDELLVLAYDWGEYPMDDSLPELYPQLMNTIFNHTRNSLPEKTRIEIATLLQARLADSIDLMMQANLWFVEAHEQPEI